jgi:hypothetical protein
MATVKNFEETYSKFSAGGIYASGNRAYKYR